MWTNPDASRSQVVADLVEAIAGRFVGTDLEVSVGGHPATFRLERIELDAPPPVSRGAVAALRQIPRAWNDALSAVPRLAGMTAVGLGRRLLVDATRARIGGRDIDRVTATAEDASIEFGLKPNFVTGPVDLEVRASRPHALTWFEAAMEGWRMQPRDDGLILAHPPGRRVGLVVEPTFFADQVRIDVRRVVVGGVAVRVPRRFAPSRTFTIPPPAPSLTVLDARAEGGDVVIRFRHEGVRYPLPLDKLRGAILSGVATIRV